jgi:tetratricopeptide (TPR) repeat protein
MGSYEFWDELGKIFNAVVAYQEKNLEFNKRFINPWIRLGNVFDKKDRSQEAIKAYEQAIEIDPDNPQNWLELGNIHFKAEAYDAAIEAFQRAIELDAEMGWPHNNLALALVAQGNYEQAIPLYQRSIELLTGDKDKAVAWNRLGNVYRKLNKYELAVQAFQRADELDRENAGFRDDLDEVPEGPTVVQSGADGSAAESETLIVNPIELIVADSRADEAAWQSIEPASALIEATADPTDPASADAVNETSDAWGDEPGVRASMTEISDEPAIEAQAQADETVTGAVQASTETFTEAAGVTDSTTTETTASSLTSEAEMEPAGGLTEIETEYTESIAEPETTLAYAAVEETSPQDVPAADAVEANGTQTEPTEAGDPAQQALEGPPESTTSQTEQPFTESVDTLGLSTSETPGDQGPGAAQSTEHDAYEEYLKDNNEPLDMYAPQAGEEENGPAPQEPVAKIDSSGELQIEMDTKNAHVWNELGNVYYNTGAFDDAIIAYSKAIELDRWFAWPYSNLALAYVQKRRFVEAILLYQRSIDLFTTGKDKAISWNRLGNVYRRLNDYENAIAAYQQADELDPDNTTLSLQSRFSLLGSYALDQKPSYVS